MIIYQKGKSPKSGFITVNKRSVFSTSLFNHSMQILGSGLITFSLVSILFLVVPIVKNYFQGSEGQTRRGFGDITTISDAYEARKLDLDPYFSIYIPKINAKANVIPNVDSSNQKEYLEALKKGVAHARSTNFPGSGQTIYLFAHSTDRPENMLLYNATFLSLNKLEKGDNITVFFLNKRHDYVVNEKLIVNPNDTSWISDGNQSERLILQTCYPPGTSISRLLVIGYPHN